MHLGTLAVHSAFWHECLCTRLATAPSENAHAIRRRAYARGDPAIKREFAVFRTGLEHAKSRNLSQNKHEAHVYEGYCSTMCGVFALLLQGFAASLDSQAATDRLVGLLRHKDSSCAGSIRRWIRIEHKPRTRGKMQRVGKLAAIMQLSRELDASITATD